MPSPGHTLLRSLPGPVPGPRARRLLAGGLSATVLLALTGCGGDDPSADPSAGPSSGETPSATASVSDPPTGSPSTEPTTDPSTGPSTGPSASTSPSTPTSQGPPDGSGGSGDLADALLGARDLPGLNADSPWAADRTGAVGDASFGWCSRFGPLTIGATQGVQRDFTSPNAAGDSAGQQVLEFVDETNARRAVEVYRGWHRDCRARSGTRVGAITSVPVADGTAWWYLSSRSAGDGEWEAFGLALQGSRVTVVRMQHTGQDHSYPPGQDPLERALETAAARLA